MSAEPEKAPVEVSSDVDMEKPKSGAKKANKSGKQSKSKEALDNQKFEFGDIVLARLRGFPPWPARVTNPEDLPANVLAQRKGANLYCAQFFPVGDFAWLPPRELQHLTSKAIDEFLNGSHRKGGGQLREAYLTAQDPSEWDAAQAEARRELEEAGGDEDVDELEDEDVPEEKGKRKRAAPAAKKEAKKAKTSKTESKPAPKASAAKDKKEKPAKETTKEPSGTEDPEASPEAVKAKEWRYKLQRAFLSKGKSLPPAPDMDQYDELLKTIEAEEMTREVLKFSKLRKVMEEMAKVEGIPRNDELNITARAHTLYTKWGNVGNKADEPKTNGTGTEPDAKSAKSDSKEEEKSEAKADGDEKPAAAEPEVEEEKIEVEAEAEAPAAAEVEAEA